MLGELAGEDEADTRFLQKPPSHEKSCLFSGAALELKINICASRPSSPLDQSLQDPEQEVSACPQASSFSTTPFFFSYPLA